jgi:hypothetical protein
MNGQTDFTVKAEPEDFKNTLAMELSRATKYLWVCFDRKPPYVEGHERGDGPNSEVAVLIRRPLFRPHVSS